LCLAEPDDCCEISPAERNRGGRTVRQSRSGREHARLLAGYRVNPEDALNLRTKIKELKGIAPLLREVGSSAASGEAGEAFDLGGNVAEWVEKKTARANCARQRRRTGGCETAR